MFEFYELKSPVFSAVFWIRISFNADPDQDPAFYVNADPDSNPDLDPGWKNAEKMYYFFDKKLQFTSMQDVQATAEKMYYFFDKKLQFTSMQDVQATRESFRSLKRKSRTSKFEISSLYIFL